MCTQQKYTISVSCSSYGKVKRMWVKAFLKSEPKVNPKFALDMAYIQKTIFDIHSFYPTVIHATHLHSDLDSCSEGDPQLQLCLN